MARARSGSARIQPQRSPLTPYTFVRLLVTTQLGPRWNDRSRRVLVHRVQVDLVHQQLARPRCARCPPISRSTLSGVSTLDGLCRFVTTISFVSRRDRPAHLSAIHRVAVLFAPREALHLRAEYSARRPPAARRRDARSPPRRPPRAASPWPGNSPPKCPPPSPRNPRPRRTAPAIARFSGAISVAVVAIDFQRPQIERQIASGNAPTPLVARLNRALDSASWPNACTRNVYVSLRSAPAAPIPIYRDPVNIIPQPTRVFSGSVHHRTRHDSPHRPTTNKAVVYGMSRRAINFPVPASLLARGTRTATPPPARTR